VLHKADQLAELVDAELSEALLVGEDLVNRHGSLPGTYDTVEGSKLAARQLDNPDGCRWQDCQLEARIGAGS
jgi:hypothetical protein